jgi:hypothetical protein
MKTAAQILDEAHTGVYINKAIVGEAMETYATQQTTNLSTQLAKANSDKEKLGEAIKAEAKEYIKLSNTWRKAQMIQDANVAEENAKKLIDLLTDCGITL